MIKLHIGGKTRLEGWTLLNIQPGPDVDVVGSCTALPFDDCCVAEIYASHVYEHLGYQAELPAAMAEAHRVLMPGGALKISVPDLVVLCRLFISPQMPPPGRVYLMRAMFGGQTDENDFHKVGLSSELLEELAGRAGFRTARIVGADGFGICPQDASSIRVMGVPISLNMEFRKQELTQR